MGDFERRTDALEVTGLRPPQPPKIITVYVHHLYFYAALFVTFRVAILAASPMG